MNKPRAVVVIAVVLIVAILTIVLLYFRGIGVANDNFTITTSRGGTSDNPAITKQVIIKGEESLIRIKEDGTTTERGLKSYEIEEIQAEATRLNIRWSEPNPDTVCGDLPKPESYLSIESGRRTGTIYFCEGIGADETGNIVGPYHDLLVLINETDV